MSAFGWLFISMDILFY